MITSNSSKQVKNLSALIRKPRERRNQGLFVVEGTKMVQEAPKEWVQAVYISESYGLNNEHRELLEGFEHLEVLSDSVYKSISDTQSPQGIMALVQIPSYELKDMLDDDRTLLLILDSIQDPGNLGTMVRTGEGAGVTGVIMNRTTVDLFNPKTIRSTMGSIYRVPFYIAEDLPDTLRHVKEAGVSLYAAHLQGTADYDDFDYTKSAGFLIGNEGNGLSEAIASLSDQYVKIPMAGQVESLNAAISAALLLYEAGRQRRMK